MRTEPLSEEEMTARLRRAFKVNARPRTKAERLATATKPTEAIAQDVTLTSDALAQRLRDDRAAERQRDIAQAVLDRAWEAMRGAQREISRYYKGSATVGPTDSDANLHISPEDELWMNWRGV
jgi:hypothetical protein